MSDYPPRVHPARIGDHSWDPIGAIAERYGHVYSIECRLVPGGDHHWTIRPHYPATDLPSWEGYARPAWVAGWLADQVTAWRRQQTPHHHHQHHQTAADGGSDAEDALRRDRDHDP
ncbi:hypothetical protein FZ103_00360 [Streptomonospora sp. PA3]|uniref:hypothetical protein n=1 Tax=Streptomonospora sp. PA3 TaxID=2607326 RepID=UPI0012DCC39C|nr:hypothetical protein [Streptomonospora sp. PA3]MUL39646.1 hypothetical protein [Streptomonospora sp. PA3]